MFCSSPNGNPRQSMGKANIKDEVDAAARKSKTVSNTTLCRRTGRSGRGSVRNAPPCGKCRTICVFPSLPTLCSTPLPSCPYRCTGGIRGSRTKPGGTVSVKLFLHRLQPPSGIELLASGFMIALLLVRLFYAVGADFSAFSRVSPQMVFAYMTLWLFARISGPQPGIQSADKPPDLFG